MNLTRFEITRLISARALQLSLGAPALVKIEENENAIEIAEKELREKVLPLIVIRRQTNGTIEKISLK